MRASSVPLRLRRLARLWPMTSTSLGIVLSFGWAVVLIWLLVCALGSFT
jgi:hypothetical protein